jgi:hypothetical protein
MTGMREKDSADFDLEAFIDLFDEALTSDDPSVQKTLQHLMVICALARNHDGHNKRSGPLRRIIEDQNNILRRLERLESDQSYRPTTGFPNRGNVPLGPYHPPTISPGTSTWPSNPGTIPPFPPGTIWAGSSTSYAHDSATASPAMNAVAERVEDLLKSPKYQGSSVGTVNVKTT